MKSNTSQTIKPDQGVTTTNNLQRLWRFHTGRSLQTEDAKKFVSFINADAESPRRSIQVEMLLLRCSALQFASEKQRAAFIATDIETLENHPQLVEALLGHGRYDVETPVIYGEDENDITVVKEEQSAPQMEEMIKQEIMNDPKARVVLRLLEMCDGDLHRATFADLRTAWSQEFGG